MICCPHVPYVTEYDGGRCFLPSRSRVTSRTMLKHITTAGLCLLALMAGQASAQLPLRLPQLPPVGVPDVGALVPPLGTDVNADLNRAAVRDLRDARRNRIRALLRANRRLLEADPS